MNLALVIKADGTIPFDADHPHKEAILGHLVATGHVIEPQADGTHKLISGPLKPR
jgi:hypothetical protein